jgi:hypothetical protein
MLSLIPQEVIDTLQKENPDVFIDKIELETAKVYSCDRRIVNIPEVFLAPIFPLMYGVELHQVGFRDSNMYNWDYHNIIFPSIRYE